MSNTSIENSANDFEEVLSHIQRSRQKVYKQVNAALIDLYWGIGKIISDKVVKETWGKGVVKKLAAYIAQNAPDIKGFSDKNLWRMKQFYETYRDDEKLSTVLREISWSHNLTIVSRCKNKEERSFYLETLDRDVKKEHENPSIGVLLCRDKDEEVVEYALSRNLSPAMVAQYQLQLPDKKLLKNKLNEIWEQEKGADE